ncbi:unnamed protein product [Calypogeia fissa]
MTETKVMDQLRALDPKTWGAVMATIAVIMFMATFLPKKSMKLPPGPPNYPIFGAMFSMGTELHRVFSSLSDKYGPIMYFKLGVLPVVVISSAEIAEELLKQRDVEFASRAHTQILYSTARYFGFRAQGIGFAANTPVLQRLRRISTTELLSHSKIMSANSVKIRNEELGAMVREINRISQKGEPVELAEILHGVTMNTMCRVLFGKRYYGSDMPATKELMEFKHLMKDIITTAAKLNISDLLPALRSLDPQGLTKEFAELHARQRKIVSAILEDHKKNRKSSPEQHDFVDTLLSLEGDEKLTDDQMMATVNDLIIGGSGTAATICTWTFVELLRHPDILSKLYVEVESAVGKNRAVNEADVANLPYLQAVAKEILRMYPPATTSIPRMNEHSATKLGGYDIPINSSVFVNLWAIGRDPANWEKPGEFIPERFLNSDIQGIGTNFQYLPFGAGRRKCPGILLGQLMVNMIIATLLQAFDFKPPHGKKPSEVSNRDLYGMVLKPKDPFFMDAKLKVPLDIFSDYT